MNFIFVSQKIAIDTEILTQVLGNYNIIHDEIGDLYYSKTGERRHVFHSGKYLSFVMGLVKGPTGGIDALCDYLASGGHQVNQTFDGLFSAFVYDKKSKKVYLASDWTSLYPVYYFADGAVSVVSSSQILLQHVLHLPIDKIGVAQRLAVDKLWNFGRRTLVEGVKRLLWAEVITFTDHKEESTVVEEGLYALSSQPLHNQVVDLYQLILHQFSQFLTNEKEVHMALSGGIDSRLTISAIPDDVVVHSHTYGNENDYETRIAKRCATVHKATHQFYPAERVQFPSVLEVEKLVYRTEVTNNNRLLAILSELPDSDQLFLLGDMCEVITGRKITSQRSRKQQIRNWFSHFVLNKTQKFEPFSEKLFAEWRDKQVESIAIKIKRMDFSFLGIDSKQVLEATLADLQCEFNFMHKQHIPYVALLDECYNIMRHTDGYQTLLFCEKMDAIPLMSSNKILQQSLSIPPCYRINNIALNCLFNSVHLLKKYAKIPLAASPGIPLSWPNSIVMLSWGLRSKVDKFLVKRMMKRHNPNLRYRFVKSLNWPQVYQDPNMESSLESYFEQDVLQLGEKTKRLAKGRKLLELHPLMTSDITMAAQLNCFLNLLK